MMLALSFVLALLNLLATWLIARRLRAGWILLAALQILWTWYDVVVPQARGFNLLTLPTLWIAWQGWRKCGRREEVLSVQGEEVSA